MSVHRRFSPLLLLALALPACSDDAKPGADDEPEDAAIYRNARDRYIPEAFDAAGPSDAGASADDALAPDALLFIDGTLPPDGATPADAAAGPDEPDADEVEPDAEENDPDAAVEDPDARVEDPDAAEPPPDECAAALRAAAFDFENGPQGFTHQPSDGVDIDWPLDEWAHGRPSSGPGACADDGACWATGLHQSPAQCGRAELVSPAIDLRTCAGRQVDLVFDHWFAFFAGSDGVEDFYDGGIVEVASNGRGFQLLAPNAYPGTIHISTSLGGGYDCVEQNNFHVDGQPGFVQESGGWEEVRMPLGNAVGAGPFSLRWAYATGVIVDTFDAEESRLYEPPGWFVDRVRFEVR